jgi:hypothetical protein
MSELREDYIQAMLVPFSPEPLVFLYAVLKHNNFNIQNYNAVCEFAQM